MPTLKAYANGLTVGCAGKGGARETKRSKNTGWSASVTRRNTVFLRSIEADRLDGDGYAFTFTMRDVPESAQAYSAAVKRLMNRLDYAGCIRWHRLTEMTARRRPHLHGSVYFPAGWFPPGSPITDTGSPVLRAWAVTWWLERQWREVAGDWGTGASGQHVKPIDGPDQWLEYLSKHAVRGQKNYQRLGTPPGWDSMPQMWSKGGQWPTSEPLGLSLSMDEFWRLRRLSKRRSIAQRRTDLRRAQVYGDVAKAQSARRSLSYLRGSLKCTDRGLSSVLGVSEWCPQEVVVSLAVAAGWSGEVTADVG